ncbi:unnamed protein product [Acanthoscelides obtectus]|uniref:Uncharacterized protein n=1 Tax=Acanthoscelides obtectus TaxID=200917 RepID=A0A9P0PBB6_ACAOB|nr:unnamed protein product [Acanthoscelides obtectus]CAK1641649.1 hypothetical protein AOBTE_LOCUS12529 [Acanthoscelides obtectus]
MPNGNARKRASIKGTLTRFHDYFHAISQKSNPDITELECRLASVELLLDNFNKIQEKIEDSDGNFEENFESVHSVARADFENAFYEIISKTKQFLNDHRPSLGNNAALHSPPQFVQPDLQAIKLPALNIPHFDGSYDQWLFFRDTFRSLIHNNDALSPIQKFHYLRLSLKGSAADTIKSLEISNQNYNVAWDLLEERFENKQLLVNNHIKALFDIPTIQREGYASLRDLVDRLQKHLRALEVLKLPVSHWDLILIYLISSKLDNATRREWEMRSKTQELPTMTEFSEFPKNKCRNLESLEMNHDKARQNQSFNKHVKPKAFVATHNENTSCAFCKRDHSIYICQEFIRLAPTERFNETRRLNLCINCLRFGHNVNNCKSMFCKCCSKPHHTLLHFPSKPGARRHDAPPLPPAVRRQYNGRHKGAISLRCPAAAVDRNCPPQCTDIIVFKSTHFR